MPMISYPGCIRAGAARLCVLLVLLFTWSSAWGQVPAANGPGAAALTPAQSRDPITIQNVLQRADQEQQRIEEARQLLGNVAARAAVRAALERIAAPVDAKRASTAGVTLRGLPVMRLESLARHYDFDARRLAAWDAQARRAYGPFDEIAMQLAQSRAAWSEARAAAALQLPPAFSARVDAVLEQIDGVEAPLAEVVREELALTQRAGDVKARIALGRQQVGALIDDADARLFRIDVAPLWRDSGLGRDSDSLWDAMSRGLQIERQFALDYNAAGTGNQHALRLVELLLLPLLLWLGARGRRAQAGQPGQDGAAVAHALRRPFSCWILLSMLCVLVLEPDAPLLVHELALIAAVPPVLRLLPAQRLHASGHWAYAAVLLYALDRVSVAVVADSGLYRWLLLVLSMLAMIVAWRLMPHLRRAPPAGSGRRTAALLALARCVLLALALSVLCNVLGNVTLAETLTSGVIDSAYMAILLYAGTICCRDILRSLVSRTAATSNRMLRRHAGELEAALSRIVAIGAAAGWLLYALGRFRVLRPAQEGFAAVMAFGGDIGEVSLKVGDALALVLCAWLALRAARITRRVLREELPGHPNLPRGVGSSIASLSYYAVLILGLLFALSVAGVKVGQLAIVFGALGVGIGFGLQNVVNNFVSGLVLMFERPIQPGDTVDAAGVSGTVREIRLRSTTIRTADGADAVIPNGVLLNGSLTNWTMYDRRRRFDIALGVGYDADPDQVVSILGAVVRATDGVAADPAPAVMMTGYGESALKFVVSVWTEDAGRWVAVRADLLPRLLSALRAAGIAIPYNQLDVNLHAMSCQRHAEEGPISVPTGRER